MKHTPGFLKIVEDAMSRVREVSAEELLRKQADSADFHLIDVREDDEWKVDRIKGAEHVGKGVIERDVETRFPDPKTELILYCGGGFRSALAADNLQKMGYVNVWSLADGIRGWREKAYPIEAG